MLSKILSGLGFGPTVVEFADGTFGVRASRFPYPSFYDRASDTWASSSCVNRYCKFKDINEAVALKNRLTMKYKVIKGV
jgi:hypothetical protein